MTLFEELTWRGFVHQTTHEELPEVLAKGPLTLYSGFDPTAASLHIGSMMPIMVLAHFQRAGHNPIALVGGATGLIGDPSFKAQERQLLDLDTVAQNVEGIGEQLKRFLDFDGSNAAVLVNNYDWLGKFSLLEFLRDVGKHFTVNTMMNKESVRQRLNDREHGMSFTEFSYSLLQGYDFYHLATEMDCSLQVGGSDQWGNIISGTTLVHRLTDRTAYGLTFPLLLKSDGTKFGKSESGNVWLDAERTSPYKFYQYWLNQADADVGRLLRYFTFLPKGQIEALDEAVETAPERREAQRALAEEVTRMVHGDAALADAQRASQAMFGGELSGLDDATLEDIFSEMPSTMLSRDKLSGDTSLFDILVETEVFASKGEARRMVKNGGLYINNERVTDGETPFTDQCLASKTIAVVRKGKKNYHLLRFE